MSAGSIPITVEIESHKKIWRELWLNMADGDPIKYETIKRMDAIAEFWFYLDYFKERQEEKIKNYREKNRQ